MLKLLLELPLSHDDDEVDGTTGAGGDQACSVQVANAGAAEVPKSPMRNASSLVAPPGCICPALAGSLPNRLRMSESSAPPARVRTGSRESVPAAATNATRNDTITAAMVSAVRNPNFDCPRGRHSSTRPTVIATMAPPTMTAERTRRLARARRS